MTQKVTILLFLISFGYCSRAQVIENESDIRISTDEIALETVARFGFTKEHLRPWLLNLNLRNDTILVNSFYPVSGTAYFNDKVNSQFSGGANLITSNYISTDLKNIGRDEFVPINNSTLIPPKSYLKSDVKLLGKFPLRNTDDLYPDLRDAIPMSTFPFDFNQNGSGMAKSKNASMALVPLSQKLKGVGYGKFELATEKGAVLNAAEWEAKTKNLYFNKNIEPGVKLGDNYIYVFNSINPDDKLWTVKDFAAVIFNKDGKILNVQKMSFEFIRKVTAYTPVYGKEGETVGLLLVFKNDSDYVGGGKFKDPARNKYNLFFINNTGEVLLKTDMVLGANPDKDDYYNPVFSTFNGSELIILNNSKEYSLKKNTSTLERIMISNDGKVVTESLETVLKREEEAFKDSWDLSNPIYIDGNFYGSKMDHKTQISGEKIDSRVIATKINFDLSKPEMFLIHKGIPKEVIGQSLAAISGKVYSIVTIADGNLIRVVESGSKVFPVKFSEERSSPPSSYLSKNYVIDHNSGKAYFLYEYLSRGKASIVQVGFK